MEDLRRLLLLRLLVVLGPGVMLPWLYFGLTPPQPLPPWSIALFLGLMALAFIALGLRVRLLKPVAAWELFAHHTYPVLAGDSGLSLIPDLLALDPDTRIVVLTGYASIATAVEAIKLGAVNYLAKPADADQVLTAFTTTPGDPTAPVNPRPLSVNRLEWEHIQRVLRDNDGNISATARQLGMHRRTLQRKLAKRPVKL